MKKLAGMRWLSILMAVMLIFGLLPLSAFAEEESETAEGIQYDVFLSSLITLENYADTYAREHSDEEKNALVINYIRCGVEKYTSSSWTTFCGPEKTAFTSFVAEQDAANGTEAGKLRALNNFTLPNGNEVVQWTWHTIQATRTQLISEAGPATFVT